MNLFNKSHKYNFEIKHIAILFTVLISFEIIMFFIFKGALSSFIVNTQQWYQEYSSSKISSYTVSSFEMLIETLRLDEEITQTERNKMIQKFDILLNQQYMDKEVSEIYLFILVDNENRVVDNGEVLFKLLIEKNKNVAPSQLEHKTAKELFKKVKSDILRTESKMTIIGDDQTFYSFIPFVPDGELTGIMFVSSKPNFSSITNEFIYNYDVIAFILSILILTGLFVMYLISSNTVNTRDKAQRDLYKEKNEHLKEKLNHEKEFVFTKRIYHAHHKAEKIIGFINRDLSTMEGDKKIVHRLTKYANFIARIIYDMKWYEPQISTIRNPIFNTNVNEVIQFMVDNLFMRLSVGSSAFNLVTELDEYFPVVHVNEFVIWEIIEPLVQNSMIHNAEENILIKISTSFDKEKSIGKISIADNGKGINADLLQETNNIKNIFLENTSSKQGINKNFGYGCFIAYNMAKRCGWELDVENINPKGCQFTINVKF